MEENTKYLLYQEFINAINEGIIIVDNDQIIQFCNPAMITLLEAGSVDELKGMDFLSFVPENFRKTIKNQTEMRLSGESTKYELDIMTLGSRLRHVELSVSPQLDRTGNTIGAFAVITDISEKKTLEDRLRLSEQRFRDIAGSSADWLWEIDASGGYTFCSGRTEKYLGYAPEEVMGKTPFDFMDDTEAARVRQIMDGIFSGKLPIIDLENTLRKKDGSEIIILTNGVPIVDKNGELTGYRGVDKDITDRKIAQKEMEKANKQLSEALSQAETLTFEAELASRAKSEFLANMSHEIRTPMNGVIGMTGLLLESVLTIEQREYAETIRNSADALLDIINDILDFSKIEAGKLELEMLDFDLRDMIDDTIDLISLRAGEKGLELICEINHDVPSLLRGDPGRLRQIVTNLIGNSIKFTREGEIHLSVGIEEEDENRALIRFSVRDTGIGIPEEKLGKLFDAFLQADSSITRKYGGTGLGLTISRQLIDLMGGEIGVESIEDEGSTFWFIVPLERRSSESVTSISEGESEVMLEGTRILVVDDNDTNRRVLSGMLESWGCVTERASDAVEALRMLRSYNSSGTPFDIAVLDMQMPDIDGETLGYRIREDALLRDTTLLIMYTSMGQRGDAARLEEMGFSAYLTKPVKMSQFHDCLVAVIHRNKGQEGIETGRIITRHSIRESRKTGVRILLAEDNIVNQKVALKMLEKIGYRADAVADGKEAIRALRSIPYDLVLMDIQMPVMDGLTATGIIRDRGSKVLNHDVPVIAITAHAMKGDREMFIAEGVNDYIPKPVRSDVLRKTISKYIGTGVSVEESVVPAEKAESDVLDLSVLKESLGDDPELISELLDIFRRNSDEIMDSLEHAVEERNIDQVARRAHSLKGSAGNIGANALFNTIMSVEVACSRGDIAEVRSRVTEVRVELGKVFGCIQSLDRKGN